MASKSIKLSGNVGFSNFPNQVQRKALKNGFNFTLLVVGESGLGKATFINSLFNAQIYPKKTQQPLKNEIPSSVEIQGYSCDLEEGGVRLKLNILDAVGFGDFLDNSKSWEPVLRCVEERYDAYLDQERRVNRKNLIDNRVHCCLYFIPPTGHSLRALDIEFMKNLHQKVNIIPVIAKADTLSEEEKLKFKKRILQDLEFNKIFTYKFEIDPDDDEPTKARDLELRNAIPFAVVGSESEQEVNGKKVRARKYPWGILEIENDKLDFVRIRTLLIQTRMEDLKSKAIEELYENYRSEKLMDDTGGQPASKKSESSGPLAEFEAEKKQQEAKLKKMEADMKSVFEQKVKEKEARLKESEAKMNSEQSEMKANLDKQIKELDEKKRQLEEAIKPAEKDKEKKTKKRSGLF